jgi:hypothetical protein
MEWATSVDLFGGTATIEYGDGESTLLDLDQLHDRGLPRIDKERHTIRIQLDEGSYTSEFPEEMGRLLAIPNDLWSKHSLYKWTIKGQDYLVPALALMRTFFGPSRHLLAEMFRPQALERICYLDFDSTPPALRLVIGRAQPAQLRAMEAVDQRLSWMLAYPTAHQMAGSVHRFGLQGRLDITLPKATAYVEVTGMPLRDTFFVTRCRLMSLTPQETPIAGVPATARFVTQKFRGHGCEVAQHDNGSTRLTDAEWAHIYELFGTDSALLDSPASRARLDTILEKLAQETAWKNVAHSGVSIDMVIRLHRALTKHGVLEKILLFIEDSRGTTTRKLADDEPALSE